MPSKLRQTSGRISFFAFQDMITTVTGVLLLITLLLTFYLNEPKAAASVAAPATPEQLQKARMELATNLARLKQQQQTLTLTNRIFVVAEPDPSNKQPILIVLSATNGLYNRLGQTNTVEFQQRADNADFRRLIEGWDASQQRLIFYIRPSGIAHFEACRKLASEHFFSFGYDPALEDRHYLLISP